MSKHILRFFLPWACAGCRAALGTLDDQGFCGKCWARISRIQGLVCQRCGLPLPDGGTFCFSCRIEPSRTLIRAAAEYRDVMTTAIHRFKYMGRRTLAYPFAGLLESAWHRYPELHDIQGIVPVPLHPKNKRSRGYNQAELLAEQVSRLVHRPVLNLLARTRCTPPQNKLGRRDRAANVQAAFSLDPIILGAIPRLRHRPLLLIDDVCTTASTLNECAKVLYNAGIGPVKALVLTRDL